MHQDRRVDYILSWCLSLFWCPAHSSNLARIKLQALSLALHEFLLSTTPKPFPRATGSKHCLVVSCGDLARRGKFPYEFAARVYAYIYSICFSKLKLTSPSWQYTARAVCTKIDVWIIADLGAFYFLRVGDSYIIEHSAHKTTSSLFCFVWIFAKHNSKTTSARYGFETLPRRLLHRPCKTRQIPVRVCRSGCFFHLIDLSYKI